MSTSSISEGSLLAIENPLAENVVDRLGLALDLDAVDDQARALHRGLGAEPGPPGSHTVYDLGS